MVSKVPRMTIEVKTQASQNDLFARVLVSDIYIIEQNIFTSQIRM